MMWSKPLTTLLRRRRNDLVHPTLHNVIIWWNRHAVGGHILKRVIKVSRWAHPCAVDAREERDPVYFCTNGVRRLAEESPVLGLRRWKLIGAVSCKVMLQGARRQTIAASTQALLQGRRRRVMAATAWRVLWLRHAQQGQVAIGPNTLIANAQMEP